MKIKLLMAAVCLIGFTIGSSTAWLLDQVLGLSRYPPISLKGDNL